MVGSVSYDSIYITEGHPRYLTSLNQRWGFSMIDRKRHIIAFKTDFDQVTEAIMSLLRLKRHEKNVYKKVIGIDLNEGCALIYKLSGRDFIIFDCDWLLHTSIPECSDISEMINDAVVAQFVQSDEAYGESYVIYQNGELQQCFFCITTKIRGYEDHNDSQFTKTMEHLGEIGKKVVTDDYFHLIDRRYHINRIEPERYPSPIVYNKMRELGIYAPEFSLKQDPQDKLNFMFDFPQLEDNAFERIDCIFKN